MIGRCGTCEACERVWRAQKIALQVCSRAAAIRTAVDDSVVQLWNEVLASSPCVNAEGTNQ